MVRIKLDRRRREITLVLSFEEAEELKLSCCSDESQVPAQVADGISAARDVDRMKEIFDKYGILAPSNPLIVWVKDFDVEKFMSLSDLNLRLIKGLIGYRLDYVVGYQWTAAARDRLIRINKELEEVFGEYIPLNGGRG